MTNEFEVGNLAYLREKYAVGFITLAELEAGIHNVLAGSGAINVPRSDGELPECPASVFAGDVR